MRDCNFSIVLRNLGEISFDGGGFADIVEVKKRKQIDTTTKEQSE